MHAKTLTAVNFRGEVLESIKGLYNMGELPLTLKYFLSYTMRTINFKIENGKFPKGVVPISLLFLIFVLE